MSQAHPPCIHLDAIRRPPRIAIVQLPPQTIRHNWPCGERSPFGQAGLRCCCGCRRGGSKKEQNLLRFGQRLCLVTLRNSFNQTILVQSKL
jgi:hypothetical protein